MRARTWSSRSASLLAIVLPLLATPARGEEGGRVSAPFGAARVLTSPRGMVVSAAPEASRVGAELLAAGGNAMDAAIGTALALAVVYPQAGNLAGGGFLVARTPDGTVHALDFRETAPARASRDMFLDVDGRLVPNASTVTALAVATPGSVRGYAEAHRRLGRLPWTAVVAPAARLARNGFLVPAGLAEDLEAERELLMRWEETRRVFFPAGKPLAPGTLLRQPELAATLERLAREGPEAFHRGEIALRIAAFVRSHGGVLSEEDLAGYVPLWRPAEEIRSGGLVVHTMPLPSSAGLVLRSVLTQLEFARPAAAPGRLDADAYHLLLEAERRAYADRNRWLGDGDCTEVPLAALLAPARLDALGASIDAARAVPSAVFDLPLGGEREETTHLSVATPDGFAVSLTTTLNGSFGNGAIVPGVGVLLNNEMDDFAVAPGAPNLYGLVQGRANEVRAGARPLSSMSPAIVERDGRPFLVLGSPGGSTIPTTVLQVLLRTAGGEALGPALDAPRLHHQNLPDVVFFERRTPPPLLDALRGRGHLLRERGPIGKVHAIAFEPDGTLTGASDPRGWGAPAAP